MDSDQDTSSGTWVEIDGVWERRRGRRFAVPPREGDTVHLADCGGPWRVASVAHVEAATFDGPGTMGLLVKLEPLGWERPEGWTPAGP